MSAVQVDFGSGVTSKTERSKADQVMEPSVIGGGILAAVLVFLFIGFGWFGVWGNPNVEHEKPNPVVQINR